MFKAKVYTVMIVRLSGTMEEVFTAKEVVRKYNQDNAESSGKLFLPVEWSRMPEDLQKVDVVIGIVGNWIEKPDFIEDCVKAGKQVVLFFNAYHDPMNTIQSEYDELEVFRKIMQKECNCVEYRGNTELKQLIEETLSHLFQNSLLCLPLN